MANSAQLESIAPGVWGSEYRVSAGLGVKFDSRMVVLALREGGLLLYSPVPIDEDMAKELAALGEVKFIVAPNGFHSFFANKAKTRYPAAELWASRALEVRNKKVRADRWLGDETPPFDEDARALPIAGAPKMQEWVLHHRASKTLVACDLAFHIQTPPNLMSAFALWCAGAKGGRLAQSRALRFVTKDRAAAAASVNEVLDLDFERFVPAHGKVVEGADAKERLRAAVWWMLSGAKS